MVQWVSLHAPNAGGLGSIPGQGTGSHMQATTKSPHAPTKKKEKKILHDAIKTWHSLNKYFLKSLLQICMFKYLSKIL